jgi:hypothetical protein
VHDEISDPPAQAADGPDQVGLAGPVHDVEQGAQLIGEQRARRCGDGHPEQVLQGMQHR